MKKFIALLPPDKFDAKKYSYVSRNITHIPFDYGAKKFETIREFLNNDETIFYVKGHNKAEYLKTLTKNKVVDLDYYKCPKYDKIDYELKKKYCRFITHSSTHINCSVNKVLKLAYWFKKYFKDE